MMNLPSTVPNVSKAPYDIWTNHVQYHAMLVDQIVPNGKVVSIVRDPGQRVRSACAFYGCCPGRYDDPTVWERFILDHNQMFIRRKLKFRCSLDGISREIVGKGNFESVLERVRSDDIFLMVTERMVESMLALQHEFRLHPLDVAFLSKKALGAKKVKTEDCLQAEKRVRELSPLDTRMHDAANEKLTQKMESLFSNTEPQSLMTGLNDLVFHSCSNRDTISDAALDYWCREKILDNVAWNNVHAAMLRRYWLRQHRSEASS